MTSARPEGEITFSKVLLGRELLLYNLKVKIIYSENVFGLSLCCPQSDFGAVLRQTVLLRAHCSCQKLLNKLVISSYSLPASTDTWPASRYPNNRSCKLTSLLSSSLRLLQVLGTITTVVDNKFEKSPATMRFKRFRVMYSMKRAADDAPQCVTILPLRMAL